MITVTVPATSANVGAGFDSLGLALSMSLLCRQLEFSCQVVEGTLNGEAHSWNLVVTQEGWRHLDLTLPTEGDSPFLTDQQMVEAGYDWDHDVFPACSSPQEEDSL